MDSFSEMRSQPMQGCPFAQCCWSREGAAAQGTAEGLLLPQQKCYQISFNRAQFKELVCLESPLKSGHRTVSFWLPCSSAQHRPGANMNVQGFPFKIKVYNDMDILF